MKTELLIILLLFFTCTNVSGQRVLINGKITDSATNQIISQVSICEKKSNTCTISTNEGIYTLALNKKSVDIEISAARYETFKTSFELKSDTTLNIALKPIPVEEVSAAKKENKNPQDSIKTVLQKAKTKK